MNRITLHQRDRAWQQTPTVDGHRLNLKGHAYIDNEPTTATSFATALFSAGTADALTALLQRMNGFYTWVEETPDGLRAAVDHIRSYPLFYALKNGDFFLSDDAEWVRQQVGEEEMDPIAREEFLLTGYVTGRDTLFPSVKQLQAGECLLATQTETEIKVSTHRFYRFLHTEPTQFNEADGFEALDNVALSSIQRLIDHANGRQIVVPLSGGYDSRLIVSLLKKLRYENILTFTYGTLGNKESEYSKQVAKALDLRWHFAEYSAPLWREAWQTTERCDYQKMASGWSSLAHVQDWLAVKIMKTQGILDKDCLFVPGHSGDFVAGSHIPESAQTGVSANIEAMLEAVFSAHYALAPLPLTSSHPKAFWEARILDRTEAKQVADGVGFADAFEKWDWQERQAKFICNSVRVYEFFGHEWWLPLWDHEFTRFWETIPLDLRKGRKWYLEYVRGVYAEQTSTSKSLPLGNASDGNSLIRRIQKSWLYATLKKMNITPLARKSVQIITAKPRNNAFEGIFSRPTSRAAEKRGVQINGLFAESFLNSIATPGQECAQQ